MKLNPLTTKKILKGIAVGSGFLAITGVVTCSILGCVAFAHLQNLETPKVPNIEKIEQRIEDLEKQEIKVNPEDIPQLSQISQNSSSIQKLTKLLSQQVSMLSGLIDKFNGLAREVAYDVNVYNSNFEFVKERLGELEDLIKTLQDLGNNQIGEIGKLTNSLDKLTERLDGYQAFTVKEHLEITREKEEVQKISKDLKEIEKVMTAASVADYTTKWLDNYFGENWPTKESIENLQKEVERLNAKIEG